MKPQVQRVNECLELCSKLRNLGVYDLESMRPFRQAANEFVRNGTSSSGRLVVPEADRVCEYVLTTQPGRDSRVCLRAPRRSNCSPRS